MNNWIGQDQPGFFWNVLLQWAAKWFRNSETSCYSIQVQISLFGLLNKQNCWIRGSERPNEVQKQTTNSSFMFFLALCIKKGNNWSLRFRERQCESFIPQKDFTLLCVSKTSILPRGYDSSAGWWSSVLRHPVPKYLDIKYPNSSMGRGCPISWSPCSLDRTPCDYCLSGYLKIIVYCIPSKNLINLKYKHNRGSGNYWQRHVHV